MSLSELPAELLHRICTFCAPPDRMKLRQVSRLLQDVADEHFMQCIPLHFVRQDFDMIEHLTLNPLIAKAVTQLHFQSDRYCPVSYEEWNDNRIEQIREDRWLSEPDKSYGGECGCRECRLRIRNYERETNRLITGHSKAELRASFMRHLELVMDAAKMMKEARQQTCFQTLFERCPRLQTVAIGMRDGLQHLPWKPVKEFREVGFGPYGDHLSSRIGYRPLHELLLAMYETGKDLKRIDIATVSHQFFEQCPDTHKYHDAISRVQDLHISINDRSLTRDKADELDLDDPQYEELDDEAIDALIEAAREDPDEARRRVIGSFKDGGFAAFLAAATKLTALSVVAVREVPFLPEAVALKHVVGEMHWPHLNTLALREFKCLDVELVDFLQRHGDTLQNLSLCNVTFTEGSAESCFESIAGKLPQLRRVSLRGRFKANGFSSSQEGDLYLSDLSHFRRPDARTRALQKYVIEGGQFPSEILAFSRLRGFWWHRRARRSHAATYLEPYDSSDDEDYESSDSDSDGQSDDDDEPYYARSFQ